MCFFVYSPDNDITVRYASEKITPIEAKLNENDAPHFAGSSEINVDFIIENNGSRKGLLSHPNTPLSEFFILYPNMLFSKYQDRAISAVGSFEDMTLSYITETHEKRLRKENLEDYRQKVFSTELSTSHIDELIVEPINTDNDSYNINLTIPDPNDLEFDQIQSTVHGPVEIGFVDSLPYISSKALYRLLRISKMSLLRCKFHPIEFQKSRWMKFNIRPKITGNELPKTRRARIASLFLNANTYNFEIKGPYNVRYEFFKRLESFSLSLGILCKKIKENRLEKPNVEIDEIIEYKDWIDKKIKILKDNISDYKSSKIEDWRLEIFSGQGAITDIREYGVFKISGSLANIITHENKTREVIYTWKSGRKNVCIIEEQISSMCESTKNSFGLECKKREVERGVNPDCYPFSGNFRIAYKWTKNSMFLQYILIALAILGFFYGVPTFILEVIANVTKYTL